MGVEKFDFRDALLRLRGGLKVARQGWNGKGFWIEIYIPTPSNDITRAFLCHVSPKGTTGHYGNSDKEFERVPWLPSQSDLFANDWVVVD